jgi:hypothetical protein
MYTAWQDGIRRVNSAPAILVGVWLLTTLVSLPLALAVRGSIAAHLGGSLEADAAAAGVNYDWMQEFRGQATGVDTTFTPTVIGFAAVLDNLSTFLDADARPLLITSAAVAYLTLLTFLAGGIIDRFARDRPTRSYGFFSACGVFFSRFVRLGLIAAVAYSVLFGVFHPWLFDRMYPLLTRNMTVERNAFFTRLALYFVFGIPLAGFNLLFDYAKVRAVVEDRRSMFGTLSAAAAFVRQHTAGVAGLYLLDACIFAAILVAYRVVAPGAGSAGWSMWVAFALSELYVMARVWAKLVFWASETSLFQSRLAHAAYVRRAEPVWPDSASAEAIGR